MLPDVNVLLAMHLPGHEDYARAHHWFFMHASDNFATCGFTQAGMVRLMTKLSVRQAPVRLEEARIALANLIQLPQHHFWPMDVGYLDATAQLAVRMQGPGQVTNAYLLGVALHHGGKLATQDKGIRHLAGREFGDSVELIS